jgi:hypothetical protein
MMSNWPYSSSFQIRGNTEVFLSFLIPAYVTHAKVNIFNKQKFTRVDPKFFGLTL